MAIDHSELAGYSLFPFEHDWVSDPSTQLPMGDTKTILGFPGTAEELQTLLAFTPFDMSIQVTIETKLEEKTLFDFFDDHKGRWKKFWIKSPSSNFQQYVTSGAGAIIVDIISNNFIDYWTGNERIYMDHGNGNSAIKKIVNVVEFLAPDFNRLTLDSLLVDEWVYNDPAIRRGLCRLVRFDQDNLPMVYKTDMTSTVTLKIKELNYEYPEV